MSERLEMECKRCGDNEDRIDGFCSNECKDKYSLEEALSKMSTRIAELEKDNDEFRQMIHDWIIILTPDDGYVPDSECVRQAMLVIDKERER
jgi:endogenous inhibitor of DNA gyrase (YacG/DUF329 family)